VDKEAREAAEKPTKNLTPPSFPLANSSPSAFLLKPRLSLIKGPILLADGPPGIRIVKVSSTISQRRFKLKSSLFARNVREALDEAFGKDVDEG